MFFHKLTKVEVTLYAVSPAHASCLYARSERLKNFNLQFIGFA